MRQGNWIWVATFQRHNGKANDAGVPTYDVDDDWEDVVLRWPCGRANTSGGEGQRGSQQTAQESFVIEGDPMSLVGKVDTMCRILIDEVRYNITAIHGLGLMSRVASIEVTVEQ